MLTHTKNDTAAAKMGDRKHMKEGIRGKDGIAQRMRGTNESGNPPERREEALLKR